MALIEKRHGPEVVVGKLNGIGGKVEDREPLLDAMRREFKEEAGILVPDWNHFCVMDVPPWGTVHMFSARVPMSIAEHVKAQEDEPIGWYHIRKLSYYNIVPNLNWLIPMALDKEHKFSSSQVVYAL